MSLYLVTGGAGFIGSHLTTALVGRGDRVRVLDDLSSGSPDNLAHLSVGELGSGAPVEFLAGDIRDPAVVTTICRGVQGIFHEAAQVSVPKSLEKPVESYERNAVGTLRVLEGARAAGVERIVYASSSAIYGDALDLPKREDMPPSPKSPYSVGKLAGEELLRVWSEVYRMRNVSLRYFNVFGPRQADDNPYTGVIAIFARRLLEDRSVTIYGDGEQTRDFTFVENVVQANLLAMAVETEPGMVFNVGCGERISLNSLYAEMAALVGVNAHPTYAPERPGDVRHSLASLAHIRSSLGYEPRIDWREGLATTVDWYRSRHALR